MSALTPTQDSMVYQLAAQMMAAATSDADTARIDRALDLVKTVQRMPTRADLFIVNSATKADAAYHVHQGQCNCDDASKRDARNCKHAIAVRLFQQIERAETDAEQLTVRVDPEDSVLDLWPDGEPCDLPAQCARCHAEETNRRHPDGLGNACISRELFGEE